MTETKTYQIGAFCFALSCPPGLPLPENFVKFRTEGRTPVYSYRISLTEELPLPEGKLLKKGEDILVLSQGGEEIRWLGVKGMEGYYARYQEQAENQAEITVLKSWAHFMEYDTFFCSLLALEKRMIDRDSLIFHCAWLNVGGEGILFSGPSGIGKSTQARLWQQYREAQVMNGDRALLRRVDGRWNACGWPVCGSSEICRLGETPIRAIVMLAQGKENRVKRLSPAKAFSRLYAQITLNQWNRAFVGRGIDLTEELLEGVPVYLLTCDMTEGAVRCLEAALFPEKAQQATH